jgi:hypothetical protein
MLKDLMPEHLDKLNEIQAQQGYDIPSPDNIIMHKAYVEEDELIAFGILKLYPEGILVLDKNKPLAQKVRAWRAFMDMAIIKCKEFKHPYLHVTVDDERYKQLLEKHYGFLEILGKHLILEV